MLFGVIALPALVPIAALLQLLFPGILQQQWKQYQYVVKVLVTQSSVIFVHYALSQWVFKNQPWWLSDKYLWGALVAVSVVGLLISFLHRDRSEPADAKADAKDKAAKTVGNKTLAPAATKLVEGNANSAARPTSLEYWALGVLAASGLAWMAYQLLHGQQPWDQMAIVSAGAVVGVLHLFWRTLTFVPGKIAAFLTTERLVLLTFVLVGIGLGVYVNRSDANQLGGNVTGEWTTFHANAERTGATQTGATNTNETNKIEQGIKQPKVLWTFEPTVRKGRVSFDSSPAVVDGHLFIGALHQISTAMVGQVYCVNTATDRVVDGKKLPAGERLWTFTANDSLQPVYSSPSVSGGRLYFGEGFHEDHKCRLFCVDASQPDHHFWTKETTSHVESDPTIVGNKLYFGAGDDGVFCLELPTPRNDSRDVIKTPSTEQPKTIWHVEKIHVDSSPVVLGNRIFVGSILGDVYSEFKAVAIDAEKGDILWAIPAEIPVVASPAAVKDRVYFGLGNGKINVDADNPKGAVWCLDAATGKQKWTFPLDNGVFASPIPSGDVVYAVSRNSFCYCLNDSDGTVKWKKFLSAPLVATPILANQKLYIVSTTGVIYCLNAKDGEIIWTFDQLKTDEPTVFSSPALVDGKLYVAIDGKVYCVSD